MKHYLFYAGLAGLVGVWVSVTLPVFRHIEAANTQAVQIVSALPATCTTGSLYNLTTATAGQNLYVCTATNTFTAVSSGSTQPVQNGVIQYCSSTTGNDSYACDFTPAFTSYASGACTSADVGKICDGTIVNVLVDTANTGTASFAPNGLTAKQVKKNNNKALKTDDIGAGSIITLAYQRTQDIWQWQSQVSNQITIVSEGITSGTFANLPTCNSASTGLFYLFTDSLYNNANCNGTTWHYFAFGRELGVPPSSSWTFANQNSVSVSSTTGPLRFTVPQINGTGSTLYYRALPGATWTVTASFEFNIKDVNFYNYGIMTDNAAHTAFVSCGLAATPTIRYARWGSLSSVSANTDFGFSPTVGLSLVRQCWKMVNDGINLSCYYGDGTNFYLVDQQASTTFLTPNDVGLFFNKNNSSGTVDYVTLVEWYATSP